MRRKPTAARPPSKPVGRTATRRHRRQRREGAATFEEELADYAQSIREMADNHQTADDETAQIFDQLLSELGGRRRSSPSQGGDTSSRVCNCLLN
jgi:hypothetical protein